MRLPLWIAAAGTALVLVGAGGGIAAAAQPPRSAAGPQDLAPTGRHAPAGTASLTAPDTPFLTSVVAQGLGLLASWDPDPAAEQITSYSVTVAPAPGGKTPPPGCAGPFSSSVSGANSADLVGGLCKGMAYQATASATNGAGTSPVSQPSSPVVPLAAQPPQAPGPTLAPP